MIPLLHEMASGPLKTRFGEFHTVLYSDGKYQCIALSMGTLKNEEHVYCRFESLCITGHILNSTECECHNQLIAAQEAIASKGKGLIVLFLDHEGRGNGAAAHIASQALKRGGLNQGEAYERLGFEKDGRDFTIGAKIIKHMEISSILFETENDRKIDTLKKFNINYVIYRRNDNGQNFY